MQTFSGRSPLIWGSYSGPLFFFDDFPVDLPQFFEQGLILPLAAHSDAEEVGAEVMEGTAVADENPPRNQPLPEFGSSEV